MASYTAEELEEEEESHHPNCHLVGLMKMKGMMMEVVSHILKEDDGGGCGHHKNFHRVKALRKRYLWAFACCY